MSQHVAVRIDAASWEAGYFAGLEGRPNSPPRGVDGLSFCSGYVEGKAHRQGYDPAGREKVAKRLEEGRC